MSDRSQVVDRMMVITHCTYVGWQRRQFIVIRTQQVYQAGLGSDDNHCYPLSIYTVSEVYSRLHGFRPHVELILNGLFPYDRKDRQRSSTARH